MHSCTCVCTLTNPPAAVPDSDISHVCRFCGELLFENENKGGDDDDSVGSEDTPDLEAFCATLGDDEEPPLTWEEKAGMITVDDKHSRGSVEVARGGRMTVVKRPSAKAKKRKTILKEVNRRQTRVSGGGHGHGHGHGDGHPTPARRSAQDAGKLGHGGGHGHGHGAEHPTPARPPVLPAGVLSTRRGAKGESFDGAGEEPRKRDRLKEGLKHGLGKSGRHQGEKKEDKGESFDSTGEEPRKRDRLKEGLKRGVSKSAQDQGDKKEDKGTRSIKSFDSAGDEPRRRKRDMLKEGLKSTRL